MTAVENFVEMPEPMGLHAGALLKRGQEYLTAFDALCDGSEMQKYPHACYFLAAHALELFLKAFLAANGATKKQMRDVRLRHSLASLFEAAKEKGLKDVGLRSALVNSLDEMNSHHDFRYPSGYNLHVPPPATCSSELYILIDAVMPSVSRAAISAQLQFASDTRHLRDTNTRIRFSDD